MASVTLRALRNGAEVASIVIPDSDPFYLAAGLPGLCGQNVSVTPAVFFDNFEYGDGTDSIFTDDFDRANATDLGAGWIESSQIMVGSAFDIDTNRLKFPAANFGVGFNWAIAVPTTATSIVDQHAEFEYLSGGEADEGAVCVHLRGNGTTVGSWIGYAMQVYFNSDGTFSVIINHVDVAGTTISQLAFSATPEALTANDVFRFEAIQVDEAPPDILTPEDFRTKLYTCIRDKAASWATWKFSGTLRGMSVLDNTLVLSIDRGDLTFVETIDLGPARSTRHLDCELLSADVDVALATGVTTWTLPVGITDDPDHPLAVFNISTGLEIPSLPRTVDDEISATGDFTAVDVAIGLKFPVQWELSDLYVTDQQPDGSTVGLTDGRLQIRYIEFNYDHTGEFTVTVTPHTDDPTNVYTYTYSGASNDTKGIYRVPVQGQNVKAKVVIGGTSARPFNISNFDWTGYLSQKTKRV